MTEDALYGSHTTWFEYTGLLKTYKVLTFNLSNPFVRTNTMSFSSQPGYVTSQDDFYIMDSKRFVAETSYTSSNNAVFAWIHYDSVPYWIRIHVANLFFDTPATWTDAFLAFRSGTYNNQWLVVDFAQWEQQKYNIKDASNIIWMVEEFYKMQSFSDVTQSLLVPQGYVASYNVPYNATIEKYCKNPTNYTNDPRAILFAKYAPNITSFDNFTFVMRLNNHSDTNNYCSAIAARCDLQYAKQFPFGALDCKATSNTMIPTHQALIQLGPTTELGLPPFTWNNFTQFNDSSHGMPITYDFDWVFIDPSSNFSTPTPFDMVIS